MQIDKKVLFICPTSSLAAGFNFNHKLISSKPENFQLASITTLLSNAMEDLSQDTACLWNTSLSSYLEVLKREYIGPGLV